MTQIQNIAANTVENTQQQSEKSTIDYNEIVGNLVHQGLPQAFNPNNYLSKIADTYSISLAEARTCLKMAIKELETVKASKEINNSKNIEIQNKYEEENENENAEEKPFAASGFYYPASSITIQSAKNDGMDNLNSFGSYNKIMFGIKN